MTSAETGFSEDQVLELAVQFAREAAGGSYPHTANRAMHDAQDQYWADRAGMELAAFKKSLQPGGFIPRLLKWWHDLRCPPSDSRDPTKLLDLGDYLACPSPLVDTITWSSRARTRKANDAFCDRLCEAIERDTAWRSIDFEKRAPRQEDYENGTFLVETVSTFHAVFATARHEGLIALIRERPTGPSTQDLSLGISYIPGDERAELEEFLK